MNSENEIEGENCENIFGRLKKLEVEAGIEYSMWYLINEIRSATLDCTCINEQHQIPPFLHAFRSFLSLVPFFLSLLPSLHCLSLSLFPPKKAMATKRFKVVLLGEGRVGKTSILLRSLYI
jgi:hypothetical protein